MSGPRFRRHRQPADLVRFVLVLGAIVGTIAVAGAGTSAYVLVRQGAQLEAIQRGRVQNVYDACNEQKARNEATVKALDLRIEAAKRDEHLTPAQERRLVRSRKFTIELIDALAPSRNCVAYVKERFNDRLVDETLR